MRNPIDLWLIFIAGMMVAWFMRAALVVRSKLNGVTGYGSYINNFLPQLVARWFISGVLFSIWMEMPAVFNNALGAIGIPAGLPLTLGTAGGFGYMADSLLDKAITLAGRKEIPPLNGSTKETGDGKV